MIGYKLLTGTDNLYRLREWWVVRLEDGVKFSHSMTPNEPLRIVMELNRLYSDLEMERIHSWNIQDQLNVPQCLQCQDWLVGPVSLNARFCSQECEIEAAGDVCTPELPIYRRDAIQVLDNQLAVDTGKAMVYLKRVEYHNH